MVWKDPGRSLGKDYSLNLCYVVGGLFRDCITSGKSEYGGDEWDLSFVSHLVLLLSNYDTYNKKFVAELGVAEMLVQMMTLASSQQTELVLWACRTLRNWHNSDELRVHLENTGCVAALQV